MHRIDTPTAQKDKFGPGKNGFTDGNPQTGTAATDLNASMFDALQEEVSGVVESQGITLDPNDNGQLLKAIQAIVAQATKSIVPGIGELYFTTDTTDPNVKYTGTTWEYLGEGVTLRTAKADGSDLGQVVGDDSAIIATENLPSHVHPITGTTGGAGALSAPTDAFDYGSPASDAPGDHVHTYNGWVGGQNGLDSQEVSFQAGMETSAAGNHVHSTYVGPHAHTATVPDHAHTLPAATDATGSGTAISILQKSINIAVWVRTA